MIDRATKVILAVIAFGLLANALTPLVRPVSVAAAGGSLSCRGELKANAWGGTAATIGGYEVALDCHQAR
jgi:hypothetical protein